MKVHYINILLFALPLNILEHNKNEPHTTPNHTQTTRSLCECKLYSPANYDSDPEMKRVMQQFEDRTTQRFHEYDEKMQSKRIQCKDRCDKEIQNIILKDKLEKQMVEQLTTLETKIDTDDIPTCICEKSLEDKMEKGCLRCAGVLGGGIAPTFGLIGSVAINMWKTTEIAAATKAAIAAGETAGKIAGDIEGAAKVVELVKSIFKIEKLGLGTLDSIINTKTYTNVTIIRGFIKSEYSRLVCGDIISPSVKNKPFCKFLYERMVASSRGIGVYPTKFIETTVEEVVEAAKATAETTKTQVAAARTPEFTTRNIAAVEAATTPYYTPIIASIIAIEVIVLIMVTIYLILRYRRKKKMKKKLQYIKLLEE
ncbi:hypothetical protein PFHG_05209 [Plasmodium falciparum HB3]|uniref:Rifin n=1 Tax=Plasmodium falciparum (isolate HB3) TaxID=137071 RepID=A0A0L7KJF6_PLAFX|nr:hypothetical protein PFHG_05209 [Plasmodium falciparum HB3]